jgi:hypothetical protein
MAYFNQAQWERLAKLAEQKRAQAFDREPFAPPAGAGPDFDAIADKAQRLYRSQMDGNLHGYEAKLLYAELAESVGGTYEQLMEWMFGAKNAQFNPTPDQQMDQAQFKDWQTEETSTLGTCESCLGDLIPVSDVGGRDLCKHCKVEQGMGNQFQPAMEQAMGQALNRMGQVGEKKMKCPVCGQMVWPDHTPNGPTCQKNQGLRRAQLQPTDPVFRNDPDVDDINESEYLDQLEPQDQLEPGMTIHEGPLPGKIEVAESNKIGDDEPIESGDIVTIGSRFEITFQNHEYEGAGTYEGTETNLYTMVPMQDGGYEWDPNEPLQTVYTVSAYRGGSSGWEQMLKQNGMHAWGKEGPEREAFYKELSDIWEQHRQQENADEMKHFDQHSPYEA